MTMYPLAPRGFGHSTIYPIINNYFHPLNNAYNYRPITIMSIVAKVLESCIVLQLRDLFSNHTNQFGFVNDRDCNKAICFNDKVNYFKDKYNNI